jgi:UDP-N-acetylglucosamine--N-acetylmuramyl-(pentapeptide) pyrophosphoryl-undecaprenol N-acetylglucosamine transferase
MEFRPEVVIGFGTIDTVPLLLFAWFFRIKTIIHEQNVIPGRANILLSKFVDKVAISFGETRKYLNNNKILLTGNPIRKEMVYIDKSVAKDFFAFKENAFTILIMGGSQGSYRINRAILDAFDYFGKERASLQIIHISGVEDYNELLSAYNDLRLEVRLFPFLREMEYAYSLADLAICRAGATTISELIYFKLPALLVPYPFARRHQEGNAGLLEKIGAAIVVEDSKLDGKILSEIIEGFLIDSEKARAMRSNYGNLPVEPNKGDPLLRVVLDSQYK